MAKQPVLEDSTTLDSKSEELVSMRRGNTENYLLSQKRDLISLGQTQVKLSEGSSHRLEV